MSRSSAASLEARLYYRDARARLYAGDCRLLLPLLPAESVDAVVTDPPYHLLAESRRGSRRSRSPHHPFRAPSGSRGFMNEPWDGGAVAFEQGLWAEVLRVAKPGAHLLAFGAPRTYHRLASAVEAAGWEIRDCLVWAYASGFPKSRNLDGAWRGWGSALKPAWEPILLARKPLVGSLANNVAEHATGALHIDVCRIPVHGLGASSVPGDAAIDGRWPANLLLGDPIFDGGTPEVVGGRHSASGLLRAGRRRPSVEAAKVCYGLFAGYTTARDTYGDAGGFSRFFLVPKASRREREAGLETPNQPLPLRGRTRRNHHPTVKPIALLRHLVRLVTPLEGTVLDPFLGSGTTAIAASREGMRCLAIDQEPKYLAIAAARLSAAGCSHGRAEP